MAILEFSRRYAMAHRLRAVDSVQCAIPHGHNEIVTVRLAPLGALKLGAENAHAPFGAVKARWHGWIDNAVDHTLHLDSNDPLISYFREHEPERLAQIMTFPGDPTTEALAACFWLKLEAFLKTDALPFKLEELRIEETPTNTVVINRDVFDADACGVAAGAWPRRPDMSINEFDQD
jgi:6-pyruvoyltetrahydropterin/6-carboxytetrahydropterin synthase